MAWKFKFKIFKFLGSLNAKEEHSDEASEDEESEENNLTIPNLTHNSANFSSLSNQMVSPELTPWLYRPTPLPGYLPLQTSFLTSRFAGTILKSILSFC